MTEKPNILLITVDDMNWDAVGAYGCPLPHTTPNIDQLAAQGLRFAHAHVTIAVCQPSRSALMTGRYPHHSGGEGFHNLRFPNLPILPHLLRTAGYQVGILGKQGHSTPYAEFAWDLAYDMNDLGHGRNPALYRQYTNAFINQATATGEPFFLMANAHDPHRPFYGNDHAEWYQDATNAPAAVAPSATFSADQITTPGFLADLPPVRQEIAEYYSSVRRADDTVGAVLDVLKQRQIEQNTIVIFLSDNGMAFPFAKTNCYLHSTKTPWIMRWPAQIKPGRVDAEHIISGIDLMPTLLDAVGLEAPPGMDGFSFMPLLQGQTQKGRDLVFTQFYQTAGKRNYPMRCVQSARYGYIFNPWSNGTRVFKNESQAGRTMQAMQTPTNTADTARRVAFFLYRTPEELYDFSQDPDALNNLIGDPAHADELNRLRAALDSWMETTQDPALEAYRKRSSAVASEALMEAMAMTLGGE
jgi:N-sulfoglucosamine sulfohydrolase